MTFENADRKISTLEIQNVESELGLKFPEALKKLYLESNGGVPIPYMLLTEDHCTSINATLPLFSDRGSESAPEVYRMLVLDRQLVPRDLFPFAVDSGGDYFYVDCRPGFECVYVYVHDTDSSDQLQSLDMDLETFWRVLKEEE